MEYKFLKGKINALGQEDILGVDFSPKKTCNFDCLYCGVGRTNNWQMERTMFFSVEEIFEEIQHFIENNNDIRGIILTGSGEPALYIGFGELAMKIKMAFPKLLIMAYTNASLLNLEEVRQEFSLCDILGVNINSVFEEEFQKICRPYHEVVLQNGLDGLLEFSKHFKGKLLVDTKFVKAINDTERNVQGLIEYLTKVQPNNYVIIFSNYRKETPSKEFQNFVKEKFANQSFPVTM